MRERQKAPGFRLLGAMLYCLDICSEKRHIPKRNAYLFPALGRRRHEPTRLSTCWRSSRRKHPLDHDLEHALTRLEAGMPDRLRLFSTAVVSQMEDAWPHMATEEKTLISPARKHLPPADWAEITSAFGDNGDQRFGSNPDHEFRDQFSRIVNPAPPPIGIGPDLR